MQSFCHNTANICKMVHVVSKTCFQNSSVVYSIWIAPLHDLVTWYRINYAGTQITQWDFQNRVESGWTGKSFFVLEVPLRYLRPSIIYSVPCDRKV